MCTMTWWREKKRYGVFFNRDEMKTRPRAEPPSLRKEQFLAPLDPTGGGTWISANRGGLIIALLNRWHDQKKGLLSRGRLVWDLSRNNDIPSLEKEIILKDLTPYPSFTLLAIDHSSERQWDWNGEKLTESLALPPISSSSFDTTNVIAHRAASYVKTVLDPLSPNQLEIYHEESSHGAYSTRMCRPDAQTWSRSSIEISPEKIQWNYLEEFLDHKLEPQHWHTELSR